MPKIEIPGLFNRIKKIRAYYNLTIVEFAKRMSCTAPYILNIEKDARDISEIFFKLCCWEFDIDELWLELGIEPMIKKRNKPFNPPRPDKITPSKECKLLKRILALQDELLAEKDKRIVLFEKPKEIRKKRQFFSLFSSKTKNK